MSNHCHSSDSTWKSQAGFIWSLIGSAVGFANILSFSAHVYKNGGGAFLIPYCMALLILGVPFLMLEGIIGYKTKSPLVTAYGSILGQKGKILGWLSVLACLSIGGFYIVLTGYSVAYAYFSAGSSIPMDTKSFFTQTFLKITPSLKEFGSLSIPIFLSTLTVATAAWFVLCRNVKDGIEKICSIFMPLLAILITLFAMVVTCLPGGAAGWAYYLTPSFEKLFDLTLWRDVFGQLFFSLSLGLGIIVGYSRHTGKQINIAKTMAYVALGDFAVSFLAGAAIFGCLAHVSYMQGIPFNEILSSDSTFEIGFIVFPHIFKAFGPIIAPVIGFIFFFCLFIAGITGVFSIVESIAGNLEIEFRLSRKQAVSFTLIAMTALATLFCMGNASHLIDALVPMVMGTNMLIGGISLLAAFLYGSCEIKKDPIWQSSRFSQACAFFLKTIAPILLIVILAGNLSTEFHSFGLEKAVRWAWFFIAIAASWSLSRASEMKRLALNYKNT